MPYSESSPARPRRSRLRRLIRHALKKLAHKIDHGEVVEHVREEGHVSGRYLFMTVMSCAVATLGLLLSSPAVIIGAMLISPLMGPIMLMGFSISIIEWPSLRTAILAQLAGIVAALAISFLIVWLSPLKEATPEILARTRPNLFDLLVAVFSGLAGGYAVIHRKGETIVGVAIATALMPPLAVVGFGLAIGDWTIASGSFFLFMTNLLAIAFCVVGLSKVYSFGEEHSPRHTLWQSTLILIVLGALSVPLGLALTNIATETTISNQIRGQLLSVYEDRDARLSDFSVNVPPSGPISVNAVVMTTEMVPGVNANMAASFSERYGREVAVTIDQVLVNEDRSLERETFLQIAERSFAEPLRERIARIEQMAAAPGSAAAISAAVPIPLIAKDIDAETLRAVFVAAPTPTMSLEAFREIESGLQVNYPDWTVTLVPPVDPLPEIVFEPAESELGTAARAKLALALWALERWGVQAVDVVGHASTQGNSAENRQLAAERANIVAAWFGAEGIRASPSAEYPAPDQEALEREFGRSRFQRAVVRPISTRNN
ncbi:MAG: DUF389 domain-containing protein [Pseudomonadota bacterium]